MSRRQSVYFNDETEERIKRLQNITSHTNVSSIVQEALKRYERDQDAQQELRQLRNRRRFYEKQQENLNQQLEDIETKIKAAERHQKTQEQLRELREANFLDDLEKDLDHLTRVADRDGMTRAENVAKYGKTVRDNRGYEPLKVHELKVALHHEVNEGREKAIEWVQSVRGEQ